MRLTTGLLAAVLAVLLAGCGDGPGAGGADPATLVPGGAPLYFEVVVEPEGEVREGALAAASKLLGTTKPEEELKRVFGELTGGEADYDRDVGPWLGERVGAWVQDFESDTPGWALIAAATDTDKGIDTIVRSARRQGTTFQERTHAGVDYRFDGDDGTALAAIGDFVVVATERELKRAIDASKGESLAESDKYEKAIDELPDERLGVYYFDLGPLISSSLQGSGNPLGSLFASSMGPATAGALIADGDRVAVESTTDLKGNQLLSGLSAIGGGVPTPLLGELPSEAEVAFGIPEVGKTARELFEKFGGAFGGPALKGQLRSQLGLDLDRDVFSWIGDVAAFAHGAGANGLGGAVVIEVTDDDRAEAAFGKLIGLLQTRAGAPISATSVPGAINAFKIDDPEIGQPIVIARAKGRVVIGYGESPTVSALRPAKKLSATPLWQEVEQSIGDGLEPSLLVDMGFVTRNVRAFGGDDDEDYGKVKPYLDRISVIAAGAEAGDDSPRQSLAIGFK